MTTEQLAENFATLADPNRGRIVIVGLSEDNNWRLYTGMGGRSDGSKNRYYQPEEDLSGHGDYIRTAVHDPSKLSGDPAATLYIAHRNRMGWHVASNGEQTESILSLLATAGCSLGEKEFSSAQFQFENEGEKNGYTARISAAAHVTMNYALMGKIVRRPDDYTLSDRYTYIIGDEKYPLSPGEGYVLYTYNGDGGLDPDYSPPRRILLPGSLKESMNLIWDRWDPNTRAGLVGKEIERSSRGPWDSSKGSDRFVYAFRTIHDGRPGKTV